MPAANQPYELPYQKDTYELPTYQKDTYEPPGGANFNYGAAPVSHPSPQLKPGRLDKAKQRAVVGDSQNFSQPYGKFNYESKIPMGSKMETYENKEPVLANSKINMKDDFFDKMMQDNNLGSTFYKQKQENT